MSAGSWWVGFVALVATCCFVWLLLLLWFGGYSLTSSFTVLLNSSEVRWFFEFFLSVGG